MTGKMMEEVIQDETQGGNLAGHNENEKETS